MTSPSSSTHQPELDDALTSTGFELFRAHKTWGMDVRAKGQPIDELLAELKEEWKRLDPSVMKGWTSLARVQAGQLIQETMCVFEKPSC